MARATRDAGGAGGALHGAAAEAARQEAAAQVLRDAAAASDGAASDGAAAAEFAASHAGGGNGSPATLRWQMHVGWAAILVLGAFMVGRKFLQAAEEVLARAEAIILDLSVFEYCVQKGFHNRSSGHRSRQKLSGS